HDCGSPYDTHTWNGILYRKVWAYRFHQPWYMHSGGLLVDGVETYNIAGTGAPSTAGNNNIIRNSYFHDYNAQGLQVYGAVEVYNNVFVDSVGGLGLYVFGSGARISNNTLINVPQWPNSGGTGIYVHENAQGPITLENNIIVGYNYGISSDQAGGAPVIARNN